MAKALYIETQKTKTLYALVLLMLGVMVAGAVALTVFIAFSWGWNSLFELLVMAGVVLILFWAFNVVYSETPGKPFAVYEDGFEARKPRFSGHDATLTSLDGRTKSLKETPYYSRGGDVFFVPLSEVKKIKYAQQTSFLADAATSIFGAGGMRIDGLLSVFTERGELATFNVSFFTPEDEEKFLSTLREIAGAKFEE